MNGATATPAPMTPLARASPEQRMGLPPLVHLVCRQLPLFHHDLPHEYFVHQMQKERYAHADGDEGRDACEYSGLNPSNHLNRSGSDTVS